MVSLKNVCAAVLHLLAQMKPGVEVYNIVDRESYSVRALAEMIAQSLGVRWNGRSMPLPLAKLIAAGGDFACTITGKEFPLTSSRLNALIAYSDAFRTPLRFETGQCSDPNRTLFRLISDSVPADTGQF